MQHQAGSRQGPLLHGNQMPLQAALLEGLLPASSDGVLGAGEAASGEYPLLCLLCMLCLLCLLCLLSLLCTLCTT